MIAIEEAGQYNGTGGYHMVGLKADGTVLATGGNGYGQCNIENWSDIIKISTNTYLTLGLKSDGTVVVTDLKNNAQSIPTPGWDYRGQDNVSDWTEIKDICATSPFITIGMKSDGSIVAVGRKPSWYDPTKWTEIVAIAASENHIVGLKPDGTVMAVGNSTFGKCDVTDWHDIKHSN
jgi:alpha-tubulin suppressor-like RCC1 family protein